MLVWKRASLPNGVSGCSLPHTRKGIDFAAGWLNIDARLSKALLASANSCRLIEQFSAVVAAAIVLSEGPLLEPHV